MLLLVTAGLKLVDPSPDAFSGLELLSSSRWRMAAIEAEALLGLWLLTGAHPRLLWLATMFCFSLLASVSVYLGIEGQSSCGCFGARLPVSPWYAHRRECTPLAGAGNRDLFVLQMGDIRGIHGSKSPAVFRP